MLGTFELWLESILTAVKEPLYEDEKATLEYKWHWIDLRYEYKKSSIKYFKEFLKSLKMA